MADDPPLISPLRVVVLIPLRDDWASAAVLIRRLDQAISSRPYLVDVLLVDDCSRQDFDAAEFPSRFAAIRSVSILHLRRNLGHQRAIAIGLVHIEEKIPCDAVLVMDGDGEDTPEGVLQLLGAYTGETAVFARRSRRTESMTFRVFYRLYKLVHYLLTGVKVQVGNFSIVPSKYLGTLVVTSELWNHYSAAVIRSGLRMTTTPIPRGHRIAGSSKMSFVTLAAHGMSAISVYGDIVGVRLMVGSIIGSLLAAAGIAAVAAVRIFTNRAIPGWATYSIGALAIILMQFVTLGLSFTFTFLSNRINLSFVPLRDYELFVAGVQDVWRKS
ncbi:MAG: glycosyltransferase [Terracidiphilus sp.]|jgi:glycosyltransferase involved in cell wall biosynthesis